MKKIVTFLIFGVLWSGFFVCNVSGEVLNGSSFRCFSNVSNTPFVSEYDFIGAVQSQQFIKSSSSFKCLLNCNFVDESFVSLGYNEHSSSGVQVSDSMAEGNLIPLLKSTSTINLSNEFHLIHNNQIATGCLIASADASSVVGVLTVGNVLLKPKFGQFVLNPSSPTGCYSYYPNRQFVGRDTVVVSVCDSKNDCSNDTVFIKVLGNQEIRTNKLCVKLTGDITPDAWVSSGEFKVSPQSNVRAKTGMFSVNLDGKYEYSMDCDYPKAIRDTLVIQVCDAQHPTECINDTVFLIVDTQPKALDDLSIIGTTGNLALNDLLSLDLPNKWFVESQPVEGSVRIDSLTGIFEYTPPTSDYQGYVTFSYRIVDRNGDYTIATVRLLIPVVFVPQGFSPNEDGVNDRFLIKNIDNYPENSLVIFNRWGTIVYEAKPYRSENPWSGDGISNFTTIGDSKLPVGTYFYLLKLGPGLRTYKGALYLSR